MEKFPSALTIVGALLGTGRKIQCSLKDRGGLRPRDVLINLQEYLPLCGGLLLPQQLLQEKIFFCSRTIFTKIIVLEQIRAM